MTGMGLLIAAGFVPGTVPVLGHQVTPWLVAVVGTAGAFVLWHRLSRPRKPSALLHVVPEPARPYQRDLHARLSVDRRGYLFARRVMFTGAGRAWTSLRRVPADFDLRFVRPVAVHSSGGRTWWAVGNEYYWANASLRAETVEAVVDAMRWRRRARLDISYADLEATAAERRERVLAGLRPNLSKHNGLVCIRCRGVIDLREKPVEPVWTDGGVKAADLQLLCSSCSAATRARRAREDAAARDAAARDTARATYSF